MEAKDSLTRVLNTGQATAASGDEMVICVGDVHGNLKELKKLWKGESVDGRFRSCSIRSVCLPKHFISQSCNGPLIASPIAPLKALIDIGIYAHIHNPCQQWPLKSHLPPACIPVLQQRYSKETFRRANIVFLGMRPSVA